MKKVLLLLMLVNFFSTLNAQEHGTKGKEFWLAYMENISLDRNGPPQFSIYVSAEESGNATITVPATGLTFSFEYDAGSVTEYSLSDVILYALGSEEVKNFGLRVNTSTATNVFTVHFRLYFTEASMLLPKDLLGDEYHISAGKDFDSSGNSPSSFVIVATEDNTEIEIIPAAITAGLRPINVPFTITLNKGQSYQIQALGDLTGSRVKSLNGSKLAVFGGARRSNIYCDEPADNHLYDQLYPVNYAAKLFALMPFSEQGNSIFKILAIEDNTELLINGSLVAILESGEFTELVYDTPKILSANKNILVTQFNPSQLCTLSELGDPTMLQLHSLEYRIRSMQFENILGFSQQANAFSKQYLTLFTESENTEEVFINDENISTEFQEFPAYPSYSFAMLTLPVGKAKLEAPEGVLAYAYGFGANDAYSYALGFDSDSISSTAGVPVDFNIELFPNPTFDQVSVIGNQVIEKLELYSLNGRLLESKVIGINRGAINLDKLPASCYFLKIISGDFILTERVIKL